MSTHPTSNASISAFPQHGWAKDPETREYMRLREGMTLHDYLMAHAPAEPQPWFVPEMPPRPSSLPFVSLDGVRFYTDESAAEKAEGDDGYESANRQAIAEWDREQKKQYFVQWPAAWADAILAERNRRSAKVQPIEELASGSATSVFTFREDSDEQFTILLNGQKVGVFNRDEDGWFGMEKAKAFVRNVADVIGCSVEDEGSEE